jgi:hypothetical protein
VHWKTAYQLGKYWIKMVNFIVGYNGLKMRVVLIALSKHMIKHAILQIFRDYMLGLEENKRNCMHQNHNVSGNERGRAI